MCPICSEEESQGAEVKVVDGYLFAFYIYSNITNVF